MEFIEPVRLFIRRHIRSIAVRLNNVTRGKLRPDSVTTAGLVMHVPIAVFIGNGKFGLAAILLIIFGLFDVLDGELARVQNTASERGMLYDASTDRIKEIVLYSGVAYWLSTTSDYEWAFLAVIACGASITVSYVKAKGEAVVALKNKVIGHHELNRMFKDGLVSFEIRMVLLVIGLVSGQILEFTAAIAVLSSITVFQRLAMINRHL